MKTKIKKKIIETKQDNFDPSIFVTEGHVPDGDHRATIKGIMQELDAENNLPLILRLTIVSPLNALHDQKEVDVIVIPEAIQQLSRVYIRRKWKSIIKQSLVFRVRHNYIPADIEQKEEKKYYVIKIVP
jgi:hypothetical protein